MAVNLWSSSGAPTSYNPLPAGYNNRAPIQMGKEYIISFKAKSETEQRIQLIDNAPYDIQQFIYTTKNFKQYSFSFLSTAQQYLLFYSTATDIIIEDIKLVEKSMAPVKVPAKNLLPPFNQWNLHANAKVISPYELELSATGLWQGSYIDIPVIPGKTYSFSIAGGGKLFPKWYTAKGINITGTSISPTDSGTATAPSTAALLRIECSSGSTGKFIFKDPMLVEGITTQPFEPLKLVNRQAVKVLGKNLFDGSYEFGSYATASGLPSGSAISIRNINPIEVTAGKKYSMLTDKTVNTIVYFYDAAKNFISYFGPGNVNSFIFTVPTGCKYINFRHNITDLSTKTMLEEGTTVTPYEPYHLGNKKAIGKKSARSGLLMNGITDYLQLPSLTMDAVEIDCLIDPAAAASQIIIDTRPGIPNGFVRPSGGNSGGLQLFLDGNPHAGQYPYSKRMNALFKSSTGTAFTDDITFFASGSTLDFKTSGIIFAIKCYLNGKVVAEYDFTTENEKAYSVIRGNPIWQRKLARR